MNNFEKFKADLTIERLARMLDESWTDDGCDYCAYDVNSCSGDCEYGIKKFFESEVE